MKTLLEIKGKKPKILHKQQAIYQGWKSKRKYKVWSLRRDGKKSGIIDEN